MDPIQHTDAGLDEQIPAKPFLRWVGGKYHIIHHLSKYAPKEFNNYWEPFLGAGAMFFILAPEKAYLSDSNSDLMICYEYVRDRPRLIYRYLQEHRLKTSKEYYYDVREAYNRSGPSAAQAARFIYLNKTSFNGIFRVNLEGKYNVPYGYKEPPALPSLRVLCLASVLLKGAILSDDSFDTALASEAVKPGDFFYLDPPYPSLNGTSCFRHYTKSRFSWEDQEKVAYMAGRLRDRGCFVMVSNSDIHDVRELYSDWHIHVLPVTRWVAANGRRQKVVELVITNYQVNLEGKREK